MSAARPSDVGLAGRLAAGGAAPEVPVRDAGTVVLLRDAVAGPEALVVRRQAGLAFAAGLVAFPGGRVDDADRRAGPELWAGPVPPAGAAALRVAVVREVLEEVGVVVGVVDDGRAPSGPSRAALLDARAALVGGASLPALLTEHGLRLDPDALRPWARWVTPQGERRRYDTRFYVARAPADDDLDLDLAETAAAAWARPADVLEQVGRGEAAALPPTLAVLGDLAVHGDVDAALAAADGRDLRAVRPVLALDDDGQVTVDVLAPSGDAEPM